MNEIKTIISNSIGVKSKLLADDHLIETIRQIVAAMITAFQADKKVFFCGNGGSAADAQHLAAELSGRFYLDRRPLFAEALHGNVSYLTAVANDYSYDEVYARLISANGRREDILVAISTSGNSKNIIRAIEAANAAGLITVGLTGETGGAMKTLCRYLINVPSRDTPRIQESHILVGHIICELVEKHLFGK